MEESEISIIEQLLQELLEKLTVRVFNMQTKVVVINGKNCINIEINVEEPQMLIGQNGQTLFELQRLLMIMATKKLQKDFYIDLDINDYKKKKIEYVKNTANDLADEVVKTKEEKILPPMPSYERRIVHSELALRGDVVTESQGEGENRYVVIKPAYRITGQT